MREWESGGMGGWVTSPTLPFPHSFFSVSPCLCGSTAPAGRSDPYCQHIEKYYKIVQEDKREITNS